MGVVKKYRVNESEHFNLMSMYDKLRAEMIELEESENPDWDRYDRLEERLHEVGELLEDAYCVGALVTWSQLKRIREIRDERNAIRYQIAIEGGASEKDAGYAFM